MTTELSSSPNASPSFNYCVCDVYGSAYVEAGGQLCQVGSRCSLYTSSRNGAQETRLQGKCLYLPSHQPFLNGFDACFILYTNVFLHLQQTHLKFSQSFSGIPFPRKPVLQEALCLHLYCFFQTPFPRPWSVV